MERVAITEGQGGRLMEIAEQAVYRRSDALDPVAFGPRKQRRITVGGIAALVLGLVALGVLIGIIASQPPGWGWSFGLELVVIGGVVTGMLVLRRTLSQPVYERAYRFVGMLSRIVTFVGSIVFAVIAFLGLITLLGSDQGVIAGLGAFGITVVATLLAYQMADSSRAFVRADAAAPQQWDARARSVVLWLILLADVWVALQVAYRIQAATRLDGVAEIVIIIATPLLFAYFAHRTRVASLLGTLAGLSAELRSVAELAARKNSSADVQARLCAHTIRLQNFAHTEIDVRIAGFRVRGLIDPELVTVIDQAGIVLAGTPPLSGIVSTSRVSAWIRERIEAEADRGDLVEFADELRRRALIAQRRY